MGQFFQNDTTQGPYFFCNQALQPALPNLFLRRGNRSSPCHPDEPELTVAEINKVAANLKRLDSLLISGGEPFLCENLVEICAIFHQHCRISSIHLPSNGMLPERIRDWSTEILHRLPGVRLTLSLPLDGLEAVHDGLKGVDGSFRNTIETVRALTPLRKIFPALQNLYHHGCGPGKFSRYPSPGRMG